MGNLLNNDHILINGSIHNKTGLQGANKIRKQGFKSIRDYLSDEFINGVTKPNGPKLFHTGRNISFWNQTKKRVINVLGNRTR